MVHRPQDFHKILQCRVLASKVFFSSQCLFVYVHFKICYNWFKQHEKETKCTVCKQKNQPYKQNLAMQRFWAMIYDMPWHGPVRFLEFGGLNC